MVHTAAIFGLAGPDLSAEEAAFFRDAAPWGFILFARNVDTPGQTAALVARLREAVGWNAPVLVDQEGGRVQRLRPPHWPRLPAFAAQMGWAGASVAEASALRHRLLAHQCRGVGIDVNCAPVADFAGEATHPFLADRCAGGSVAATIAAVRAGAEALLAAGVLPVIKHLPGHGRAGADSHTDLPRIEAPLAVLEETDFAIFRALRDLPLGMTGHMVITALDPDRPGTQSPDVVDAIRTRIGFDGLLMTDDLNMNALSGPLGARAAAARAAGCDVALHCSGDLAEMVAVAGAAGALEGRAAERADTALALRHPPATEDDPADLAAQLARIAPEPGATPLSPGREAQGG